MVNNFFPVLPGHYKKGYHWKALVFSCSKHPFFL
jgi:hypothetical protein